MKPVSPVFKNFKSEETVYAKDQPEYLPLPTFKYRDTSGTIVSRWHMSWIERVRILLTGDIYLWVMTFNKPLQPILLVVEAPEVDMKPRSSAMMAGEGNPL